MNIYFTSDLHLCHKNIIQYCNRPFTSVEEMDATIIDNWNSVVTDKDMVYILGDFALCGKSRVFEYEYRLHGHKILIRGGHDNYRKGLFETYDYLDRKINGITFIMFHYPLLTWNKEYYGSIHLHGHSHNNPIEVKKNRINVGVDVWNFMPVSIDTIISLVST